MATSEETKHSAFQQTEATYGKAYAEAVIRRPSDTLQSQTVRFTTHVLGLLNDRNAPPHYKAQAQSAIAVLLVTEAGVPNFKDAKTELEAAEESMKKAREMYAGQGADARLDQFADSVKKAWEAYHKKQKEDTGKENGDV